MAEPTIARPNTEYRTVLIRLPALLGISSGRSSASSIGSVDVGPNLILAGNSVEIASISGLCSKTVSVTSGASTASATSATVSEAANSSAFSNSSLANIFVSYLSASISARCCLMYLSKTLSPSVTPASISSAFRLACPIVISLASSKSKIDSVSCSNAFLSFSVIRILSMPLSAVLHVLQNIGRDQLSESHYKVFFFYLLYYRI